MTSPTNWYLYRLVCWHIKQCQQKTAEEYLNYWDYFREWELDTKQSMTLPLAKHTLICNSSSQRILFWMFDTSLFKCSYSPTVYYSRCMSTSDGSTQLLFCIFDYSFWIFDCSFWQTYTTMVTFTKSWKWFLSDMFCLKDELICFLLNWLQYSMHKCDSILEPSSGQHQWW